MLFEKIQFCVFRAHDQNRRDLVIYIKGWQPEEIVKLLGVRVFVVDNPAVGADEWSILGHDVLPIQGDSEYAAIVGQVSTSWALCIRPDLSVVEIGAYGA